MQPCRLYFLKNAVDLISFNNAQVFKPVLKNKCKVLLNSTEIFAGLGFY